MSSIAASGATAQSADVPRVGPLQTRVISALVLAPAVFVCVWFGTPWFELMVGAAALTMAWEWRRICAAGKFGRPGATLALTVGMAVLLAAFGMMGWVVAVIAVGIGATWAMSRGETGARWCAAGVVVIGPMAAALVWLRGGESGLELILWLVGAIAATDIAAFFAGRTIGGPRLAPAISPNKTWAGLAGGVLAAALWTMACGSWAGWQGDTFALALLGAATAIAAQAGDLLESAVKRHFGVKDAGTIIPGHGGVLDRADGYLLVAPLLAIAVAFAGAGGGTGWL